MFVAERRPGLVIGLVAAGMVALSACSSGGSAPQTLPRLSTTPAAATSPAPPTSRAVELADASAVVRRYFELINNLSQDMNPRNFANLETEKCPCRKFLSSIADVAARHQIYFGRARIRGLTPAADSPRLVEVLVTYDASVGGIRAADSRVVSSGPARSGATEMFYVLQVGNRWYIDKIALIAKGTVH